jgi:glycosyltransferase 2 family protein
LRGKLKGGAIFAGKLLISAAMLWFVFSRMDISSILGLIGSSNRWWLAGATIFFILSKVVSACRLNLFFSAAGLQLKQSINLRLYLLGMFYNLFLPGGIGGDAYKVILLKRKGDTKLQYLVQATILDRVTGLTALGIISLVLVSFLPLPSFVRVTALILIPPVYLLAFLLIKRFFSRFAAIFGTSNLQSALVQILQLISAFMILKSLCFSGDFILLMALFLVSSIMAVLPVTFGGAGAREFTFALAGNLLAMDHGTSEAAIALGLLFYMITAVTSLAGIWYMFVPINLAESAVTNNDSTV